MIPRSADEIIVRLILFAPLALISYQVIMLRRILHSKAWTFVSTGIVIFMMWIGYSVFFNVDSISRIVVSMIAYSFLAAGFHVLRKDLERILKRRGR